MQLTNKRIIVIGGASGIGAATVRAYAREGADVVALDISDESGARVVAEAGALGPGKLSYEHCDVGDREQVVRVMSEAIARLGGLDVLAHTAGVEQGNRAEDIPEDQLERIFRVNAFGTIFSNQVAFRTMRDSGRGGSIINFGSLAGNRGYPGLADYSAAKGAVFAWTRTVAREWGAANVRVNAVAPNARTPMADAWEKEADPADVAARDAWLAVNVPLGGRFGDADQHIAPVMVFLASDASSFMTGQTVAVDGGAMMVT